MGVNKEMEETARIQGVVLDQHRVAIGPTAAEALRDGDPVVINARQEVQKFVPPTLAPLGQDRLARMMEQQIKMMKVQGTPLFPKEVFDKPGHNAKSELTRWTAEFCRAMFHETAELEDWLPWKHWSVQPGNKSDVEMWSPEHLKEIRKEIIDLFHFLISLAALWGMTVDDIYAVYCGKMEENIERHESGKY